MVSAETIGKIRRAWHVQGKSIRSIAKSMGVSRNTVRKLLRSGESVPKYRRPDQPHPKLGDFIPELERKLKANTDKETKRRDRLSMKRIWRQLADQGCDASYSAVCRVPEPVDLTPRRLSAQRQEAVAFALQHGATDPGQTNAVREALTDDSYYVSR